MSATSNNEKGHFKAYQGDCDYAFVAYAHSDLERIYPIINELNNQGFNLWYTDGGILSPNYFDLIYDALQNCNTVLFFISEASANRTWIREELYCALREGKKIIPIYLDNVELPQNLRITLTSSHAVYSWQYSQEKIINELADEISVCRDDIDNEVFVSFSLLDISILSSIVGSMRESGISVWDSSKYISGSAMPKISNKWRDVILTHLRRSRVVLAFISRRSIKDSTQINELNIAFSEKKIIIPLFVGCDLEDLPASLAVKLGSVQGLHVDVSNQQTISAATTQVIEFIKKTQFNYSNTSTISKFTKSKGDINSHSFSNVELPKITFISYSHSDVNQKRIDVEQLAQSIQRNCGCVGWYDKRLTAGRNFDKEIKEVLDQSSVVVWILSPNSSKSEYVNNEIKYALDRHIEIIPLVIANEPIPDEFGVNFIRANRIDYFDGPHEQLYSSIRKYLQKYEPIIESDSYIEGLVEADSKGEKKELYENTRNLTLLARAYILGEYGAGKDLGRAFVFSGIAAFRGDPEAMYYLGNFFDTGLTVQNDKDSAYVFYSQSADCGNAGAMCKMGDYFYHEKDYIAANRWYEASYAKDYGRAAYMIGEMYQKAQGRPESDADAITYYTKALELNEPEAVQVTLQLAQAYTYGRGGRKKDLALGAKCYRALALYGDQFSAFEYAELLRKGSITEDEHDAVYFYKIAAKSEDAKLAKKAIQRIKSLSKAK